MISSAQSEPSPYFEGRGFATGDVDGHVEHTKVEVMAFPYEIERSVIIERDSGLASRSQPGA